VQGCVLEDGPVRERAHHSAGNSALAVRLNTTSSSARLQSAGGGFGILSVRNRFALALLNAPQLVEGAPGPSAMNTLVRRPGNRNGKDETQRRG